MIKRNLALALSLLLILTLAGCQAPQRPQVEDPERYNQTTALFAAMEFVTLLDNKDYASLATLVHPTEGLRFSPYAYVNLDTDQWVATENLTTFLKGNEPLNWGSYDGTGDPISLTPEAYLQRFVYDQAYIEPHLIGHNQIVSTGNTIVNIDTAYPGATFVEFHFKGFDPQYQGMDWRSLILVLKEASGLWYVVGILHSEWTI